MDTQVINREASDKTKGFRLQKMRAIKLMLDTIENQDKAIFYTAIENVEDVSHYQLTGDRTGLYYEEDKNYAEDATFSIFTHAVKNTLVSFFDIFVDSWRSSEEVRLGFYTTATITKEKKSFTIDSKKVKPPEKPILEILSSSSTVPDNVLKMVKVTLLEEYRHQYKNKSHSGHLNELENISLNNLAKFLHNIKWFFGHEDEVALKQTVLTAIKDSKLHNVRVANKENIIFSLLMEELEARQNGSSLARKVINDSDVKLIFKQAESEECDAVMDPTWTQLLEVEKEIKDRRNLNDKLVAVCPDYNDKKLRHLARIVCRSKAEQNSSNKTFLSLKYRVYETCNGHILNSTLDQYSEKEIDELIDQLVQLSADQIAELKKDYTYSISNSNTIRGIIMDLIDSCFLSFDEAKNEN